jgi:hypothetical protein
MMRICFMMVDLPDSPAPNTVIQILVEKSLCVVQIIQVLTEKQDFDGPIEKFLVRSYLTVDMRISLDGVSVGRLHLRARTPHDGKY